MGTEVLKQQNKILDDEPEKTLIYAIFTQAVNDYRTLKLKSKPDQKSKKGSNTIQDIETFFNGNWCQQLLDGLDIKITGTEILHKLNSEL